MEARVSDVLSKGLGLLGNLTNNSYCLNTMAYCFSFSFIDISQSDIIIQIAIV